MKRKSIATLITSIAGIGFIYYYLNVALKKGPYSIIDGAWVLAIEVFLLIITAIITMSFKQYKDIGEGILIGTGITLLIGFGICSSV
jgi:hypothetical protein